MGAGPPIRESVPDNSWPDAFRAAVCRTSLLGEHPLDIRTKAHLHLKDANTIAVIGLIDLHGPNFYPDSCGSTQERCDWAKKHLESLVGSDRYHQFLAVHEVEAWLLSEQGIFPSIVAGKLKAIGREPEDINHERPPARLLDECYQSVRRRSYRKIVDGNALFNKLNPNTAYQKCPHLKAMLDCMLSLSQQYQACR